jgi:hypothetical protein
MDITEATKILRKAGIMQKQIDAMPASEVIATAELCTKIARRRRFAA